jgi:hypothetical protein
VVELIYNEPVKLDLWIVKISTNVVDLTDPHYKTIEDTDHPMNELANAFRFAHRFAVAPYDR